jgi:putative transcriptional regulator
MTIRHHPSDETLAAFAGGALDLARRLVVASHIERCPHCQRLAGDFAVVAGAMLDKLPPTPMSANALERTLARAGQPVARSTSYTSESEPDLPEAIRAYPRGKWRWAGPGLQYRSIALPEGAGASLFMLKGAPGTQLPEHTHTGSELTLLLKGSYTHESGQFAQGDFEEADDDVEHQPTVDGDGECICLVALDGRLKLNGVLGALLNPFIRL